MPRSQQMSWEGEPNFRWVKMYKGRRYRVTCEELGAKGRTKDLSQALANQWWLQKRVEIDGNQPKSEEQLLYEELSEEIAAAPAHQAAVETITRLIPNNKAQSPDRSVKTNGENYLALNRKRMKERTYQELRDYILTLNNVPGILTGDTDVGVIDEAIVIRMYQYLDEYRYGDDKELSAGAKKKRWGFFQRFVRFLWEQRLIEMPRNLTSHKFEVRAKPIKQYDTETVRTVIDNLKPRLKLYAMLALNTGMTQVDMSELEKKQVDLKKGTLTRRRVKTGDNESVPTVTYPLWPETIQLLRKHQSNHPELFLTNMRGKPLWECRYEGGEVKRKDMIVQQWRRARIPIPLKAFRSIAATLLEAHPIYGRLTSLYLGHSPKSIREKHYASPPIELFNEAVNWLHDQLFEKNHKMQAGA